ncbi:hypothetical protein U8P76_10795 [Rhizobium johnstonii]|uniref:hypothetical protein n=1 Tax=Rhizobium leguminosarum TaxID=384 RepID=UPI001030AD0E|nr:hypothetical protein [Rhizobium leguminosarum]TBG20635.1 hypothetical protein ELG81_08750 [Rhizobium leguminosarum]TBG46551.1 hypothetical protein ELG75_08765 [Rhizobium leguminosarum]TBG79522.1 hypothetical protein ELG76_09100 [Rhizobium leguminosarum]WSG97237.1 hypothetical protein U8P76_10795 [Rhizobium johnstonii]
MISITFKLSVTIRRAAAKAAGWGAPKLIEGGRTWGPVIENDYLNSPEDPDRWADRMMEEVRRLS